MAHGSPQTLTHTGQQKREDAQLESGVTKLQAAFRGKRLRREIMTMMREATAIEEWYQRSSGADWRSSRHKLQSVMGFAGGASSFAWRRSTPHSRWGDSSSDSPGLPRATTERSKRLRNSMFIGDEDLEEAQKRQDAALEETRFLMEGARSEVNGQRYAAAERLCKRALR